MNQVIAQTITFRRLDNWLFGTFAGLAVLLTIVGLYGLVTHELELSTRDIGVRIALGTTRSRIFGIVFARVSFMLVSGLAEILSYAWLRKARQVIPAVALVWPHASALSSSMADASGLNPRQEQVPLSVSRVATRVRSVLSWLENIAWQPYAASVKSSSAILPSSFCRTTCL